MRANIPPITRSKSPMLAGNKENEGNKINGGSAESLSTSATQRRGRAATPPSTAGNGRGRRPLNDLLSTSNSNPNPRRGRGRGIEQHPSPLPLRKCSPSPTPSAGTPTSTSCTRSSKLDKSEELPRSRGSVQSGVKDKALSRTFFQPGKTPSQNGNGMKKNCGLNNGNLPRSRSGSFGSAGRKRHDDHKEGHDSLRGRSQETVLGLPMVGSPKPTSGAALQRDEIASIQKVLLNNCYATPAPKLLEKVYNYHSATPATRLKGRYQDSVPTHVFVGREDAVFTPPTIGNGCDFTSAPTILRKGGYFTPASNPDGKVGTTPATRFKGRYQDSVPTHVFVGREDAVFTPPTIGNGCDFTSAPTILGKGGDVTPASNPDGKGGATPATRLKGRYQDSVPTHVSVGREDAVSIPLTIRNGCDFTPAPTILRKGGDFTPVSNPDGKGGATSATRFKGRHQDSVPTHVSVGREDAVFTPPTIGNGCNFTPAPTILRKGGDFTPVSNPDGKGGATPATRFKGRYLDSVPPHVLVGREDAVFTPLAIGNGRDFTPAPTTLRKGGDFTPSSNSDGKGGDVTPFPASNWNREEFTPAQHNVNVTPDQRTQITPPVQPSISPEIHSQNLDELRDGHRCFGAGHVMAPVLGKVRDRRKCRPRGILTVGEATPILLDRNRRFSLDPMPMAASVKWMSPRDAKNLTNLPDSQATPSSGFTQSSSSISSKYVTSQASTSPGFTQTTPSSVPNSKSPNPRTTSLSGVVANCKSPSPRVTPLSGIDGSFSSGFSSSSIHQAGSLYGLTPSTTRSGLSSKLSNHESTISSRVTPENLSTVLPTVFAQEVPHIRGILSPMLTTGTGNLESTPSGNSSKFQNYICSTPSGLTPDILTGQGIPTLEHNQEISNLEASPACGISPQVVACCKSDIDISPKCWFHRNVPYQCGVSQGMTLSLSSQSEFNPNTFPQDSDTRRACLSSANIILPSQCTSGSEVARPSNSKASSIDRDNLRQEFQMPIPSSKGFTQVRISWRDGLMSRIFELSELDSCDLTFEGSGKEEHKSQSVSSENSLLNSENNTDLEYSCPFSNDLQLDAPFGSFVYLREDDADMSDPSVPLASSPSQEYVLSESLVRSFISPASQGVEAESIYSENITSSGDLDWTFCYKNQLFEEAA